MSKETCCKEENNIDKNEDIEKLEVFLKDLISKMGTDCELIFSEDEEAISIDIEKSEDFKMLIGKSGETLESIQYILNIFARRNTSLEKEFI